MNAQKSPVGAFEGLAASLSRKSMIPTSYPFLNRRYEALPSSVRLSAERGSDHA
jgi:hypothetical protein